MPFQQEIRMIDYRSIKLKKGSRKPKEEEKDLPKTKSLFKAENKESSQEALHIVDFEENFENNSSLSQVSPEMIEVEFI